MIEAKRFGRDRCVPLVRPLVILALAALAVSAAGAQTRDTGSVVLRDGVVVDADRETLYLMRPGGGLEARGLARGELRWQSDEAARPLYLFGHRLIAQADTAVRGDLALIVLNTRRRGARQLSTRLEMPPDVWTGIDDGLGTSFSVEAEASSGGIGVVWQSDEQRITGARLIDPPDPPGSDPRMASPPPAPRRVVQGAARVDLGNGLAAPDPPGRREVRRRGPRRAGPDVLPAERGAKYLSADGRHALVSVRVADDREWNKYRWQIYDLEKSTWIGALDSHFARTAFVVAESVLLFEERPHARRIDGELRTAPLRLRAVDLRSGAELWQRPIRDTTFRGPFPP